MLLFEGVGHYNCVSEPTLVEGVIKGEKIVQIASKADTILAVSGNYKDDPMYISLILNFEPIYLVEMNIRSVFNYVPIRHELSNGVTIGVKIIMRLYSTNIDVCLVVIFRPKVDMTYDSK